MATGRIIVYGGRGALGAACVNHFKAINWWVANVDLSINDKADANVMVPRDASWAQQEDVVVRELTKVLDGEKVNAVICVAGGWAGGNTTKELCQQSDLMWRQSVWSSIIAATVATRFLMPGGVIALTGAKAALEGTPGMIGYGLAKAAVHQLTKSLGSRDSGLPEGALAVAILPVTLDTEMNRKWMPNADFGTWTPLSFVAELFYKWVKGEDRPKTGSLVTLVTENYVTDLVIH
ncbi:dihydropteridine reductase [Anticarsia gemmatalis]|uniref:dihydropteridine reductase n=1 Tax=Anticarsia gemmatalis TaxID=129554 RepID=UPI003F777EE0